MRAVRKAIPEELPIGLSIRREVFVIGQGVPEALETDGLDGECTQFLAFDDGVPLGTARLRRLDARTGKVERVAVLAAARGRGLGDALMDALETEARALGFERLTLYAQSAVTGFYEKRGYTAEGEEFQEAGIPHQKMRLNFV